MGNLSRAVIERAFSRHHHDKIGNYSDVEQQEYDLCRALIDFQQYQRSTNHNGQIFRPGLGFVCRIVREPASESSWQLTD